MKTENVNEAREMHPNALDYLACPRCGGDLTLAGSASCDDDIRQSQVALCSAGCGGYPVESGVPRLLPELNTEDISHTEQQRDTGHAFGAQWDLYEYGNTTWGVTVEERIHVVLHELGWSEAELEGKVILDAGCGNGTLSKALADRGATVVAVDLSDSVFRAHQLCSSPRLHFVQGNLFFPPFKPGVFDAIYSCGVFHHTPDTRRCFDALMPTLRHAHHARYFVWLYSKRSWLFNTTVEPLMKLTRRMPSGALILLCKVLAIPVEVGSRLLTLVGAASYAPRNFNDRLVQPHDLLSPPFVWYHSFEETRQWALQQRFQRITQTHYSVAEEDSLGLKRVLDKYRSVCRPGFGMLCHDRVS